MHSGSSSRPRRPASDHARLSHTNPEIRSESGNRLSPACQVQSARPAAAQAALKSAGQAIGALGDSASALSGGDEKASAAARLAALQRLQAAQAAAQNSLPGAPSPALTMCSSFHHVLLVQRRHVTVMAQRTDLVGSAYFEIACHHIRLSLHSCRNLLRPLQLAAAVSEARACEVVRTSQVPRVSCWSNVLLLWSIDT